MDASRAAGARPDRSRRPNAGDGVQRSGEAATKSVDLFDPANYYLIDPDGTYHAVTFGQPHGFAVYRDADGSTHVHTFGDTLAAPQRPAASSQPRDPEPATEPGA